MSRADAKPDAWAIVVILAARQEAAPAGSTQVEEQEQPVANAGDEAERLFKAGRFEECAELCRRRLLETQDGVADLVRLGAVELFANRVEQAAALLRRALELAPQDRPAQRLLAEALVRADDYAAAVPWFEKLGDAPRAQKLASFGDQTPYELVSAEESAQLAMLAVDPLPLVELSVNGRDPSVFLVDTGGGELLLDSDFAREVGAQLFGGHEGLFAGGRRAPVQEGRVDEIRLDEVVLRAVPVHVMSTAPFSGIAGGRRLCGVVGALLLHRFIARFDFAAARLVLFSRSAEESSRIGEEERRLGAAQVPYWLAPDHFMLARGSVNGLPESLLFVDTGLGNGAFTCPRSTIEAAGIELSASPQSFGGGGGATTAVPIVVRELSLGAARQRDLPGFFGPFPPTLEDGLGFHLAGLISHAFFRRYVFTIDPVEMKLWLRPA
jgi:predicted aspartyl protease